MPYDVKREIVPAFKQPYEAKINSHPAGCRSACSFPPPFRHKTATNGVSTELRALVQQVRTKIAAGKNTEADLAPELKNFDNLIAKHASEKTDEMSQILYMEAMLYLEVLNNPDKGKALIEKLKTDFPDTKLGKNADSILQSLDKQAAAKKIQAALAPGSEFPDFNVKSLAGQPLSVAAIERQGGAD